MNHDNLSIPQPFMLLDVKVTMEWDHPNDAWVAIVDAEHIDYDKCEPNDQGLTGCTLSDFTILAGGPESEGSLVWDLEPGSTRFITRIRPPTPTRCGRGRALPFGSADGLPHQVREEGWLAGR